MKRIKHRFFSQRSVLICFLFIVATCTIMFMMMFFSRISREQAAISEISRIYPDARLIYGVTLDWSDQKNRDVWCVPVQDFIANVLELSTLIRPTATAWQVTTKSMMQQ